MSGRAVTFRKPINRRLTKKERLKRNLRALRRLQTRLGASA